MPGSAFGRVQVSSKKGVFPDGQQARYYCLGFCLVSINANGVSLLAECRAKRCSPLPVLSSAAVSSLFNK